MLTNQKLLRLNQSNQIKTGMQAANTSNTQTNSKAAQTQITGQRDGRTRRTAKTKAHDILPGSIVFE